MTDRRIKNVVIAGGGSAGWMTAAALSKFYNNGYTNIRLVESDAIATVGVGEATIPPIQQFNRLLGLDEREFIRATQATFKLAIRFMNWTRIDDDYLHPFGEFGLSREGVSFHHVWLRARSLGLDVGDIDEYCLPAHASWRGKFDRLQVDPRRPLMQMNYAFHFDAYLYSQYLRGFAEMRGVQRTEGKIVDVELRGEDGFIEAIRLESGERIEGDLFIDCSGFRGILIEKTLETGFLDWSAHLPNNRAVAMSSGKVGPTPPYTKAIARKVGWQWCIPLQHRNGEGQVYCSEYMSDDEAVDLLKENLAGPAMSEPNFLRFTAGRRKLFWNRNCIAIGLAGGFLEPLESTSIHLIQTGITRLLRLFPDMNFDKALSDEYNSQLINCYEHIRDFLVLHYNATERNDSPFWDYVRTMETPDTLKEKLALYKAGGRLMRINTTELFAEPNWIAVLMGQEVWPDYHDPIVDRHPPGDIQALLDSMRAEIKGASEYMPTHDEFIERNCKAPDPDYVVHPARSGKS